MSKAVKKCKDGVCKALKGYRYDVARGIGDDVGRFDFLFTYLIYGFWTNFSWNQVYPQGQFYLMFDIICIVFLLQKPLREYRKISLSYVFFSLMVGVTAFVGVLLLSPFVSMVDPAARDLMIFSVMRGVPSEELVFRGTGVDAFARFFESFTSPKNARAGGHMITAILFAIYHIPAYGFNPGITLYMLLLSLLCSVAREFGGIEASIVAHRLNNVAAMFATASIFGFVVI